MDEADRLRSIKLNKAGGGDGASDGAGSPPKPLSWTPSIVMVYIVSNAVAILLATCAGLAVGAAYAGLQGPGQRSSSLIAIAIVAEFWLACILAGALILAPPQAGAWTMALGSAVVIWIGFVAPTLLVTNQFDGLPVSRGLINSAHWLIVMLVQAAVLHSIGLVRPA